MAHIQILLPCLAALCFGVSSQGGAESEPVDSSVLATDLDPEWIWCQAAAGDQQRVFFAASIRLNQPAKIVDGMFTADNSFELWIDGAHLLRGTDFRQPSRLQVGPALGPGEHLICIAATNESGPAGLAGFIEFELEDGSSSYLQTSPDWTSWETQPAAWPLAILSDSLGGEPARGLGSVGAPTEPWGDLFGLAELPDPAMFLLPDGLVCERIYAGMPKDGSWASMTFGQRGSLYVSGERGSVLSFEISEALLGGGPAIALNKTRGPLVEGISKSKVVELPVHSAQGLEWAYDSLYVVMSRSPSDDGGLHRLRDTDGDGALDQHEQLAVFGAQSEHGPHGIRLAPDGALYMLTGNYVSFPERTDALSPLSYLTEDCPPNVQEDVLLPRIWDPRNHAAGIMAPGGQLWRTDKDGAQWEQIAWGMRNPYDLAITDAGEIFTYDADMEWDHGTPWFRSPRVVHLVPGGEYGWRAGSAKWPASFADSLPPLVETDLASPTGIELGAGSAFSDKYQGSLFLGDWAWGRITMAQLQPDGASYSAEMGTLIEGRGLAVTDMEIGPDGWLWFVIGGRGTQSGLFRIREESVGAASASAVDGTSAVASDALALTAAQLLRRNLGPEDIGSVIRNLRSDDRFLAHAARRVLEQTDPSEWFLEGMILDSYIALPLARAWPEVLEAELQGGQVWVERWLHSSMKAEDFRHALRTTMVMRMRLSEQSIAPYVEEWSTDLRAAFPTKDASLNREIGQLLTGLEASGLPALFLTQMTAAHSQEHQLHFALLLRLVDGGWTDSLRTKYFTWFQTTASFQGGASLAGFVKAIEKDALALVPEGERQAMADLAKVELTAQATLPQGPFVKEWNLDDLLREVADLAYEPDPLHGAEVFRQALCVQCHRVGSEGGVLGPDLTSVTRRFGHRDLFQAILEPTRAVSDQYQLVSMPAGLLDHSTSQDIADLEAFLEQGRERKVEPK
ncbi:MAG: mono/diheme cytochrome c family protein [Planctomycetota bacterium]|jgi:mono/diheme cytochrome c family protein